MHMDRTAAPEAIDIRYWDIMIHQGFLFNSMCSAASHIFKHIFKHFNLQ